MVKKMIARRLVWPLVSSGAAWAADRMLRKGIRKVGGKKMRRGSMRSALVTAAVTGVVGVMAEEMMDRAMNRGRKRKD